MPRKQHTGFTLIELLVVIAIIGVLASVILVSLNTARAKSRDSNRITQLKELEQAIAMYYLDHGSYPSTGSMLTTRGSVECGLHVDTKTDDWIPGLVSGGYIPSLPFDPKPVNTACYIYASNGKLFILSAWNAAEGSYTPSTNPLYSLAGFRETAFDQNCLFNHSNIKNTGYYNRSFTISNVPDDGTTACN